MFTGQYAGKAEEAINFYISVFKNSKVNFISRYKAGEGDVEGTINYASFILAGQEFSAMDSSLNHKFSFNEAVSLLVNCRTQEEVDIFWEKLTMGGEEQVCGWLKDKFGVSWQVVPTRLSQLLTDRDRSKADRVMNAMLKMKKINIHDLERV
jgi:predicted 3-demethylubiquinone-9 3-methyltransferase (glyoxalase superfamily)